MLLILRLHEPWHHIHGPDVSSVHSIDCPSIRKTADVNKRFVYKWHVTREQALTACRAVSLSPRFLHNLVSLLSRLPFSRTQVRDLEMRDTIGLKLLVESCPLVIDRQWNRRVIRLVINRMETEDQLALLSTLGGGFSCLGDWDPAFGQTAGRIAVQQLFLSVTRIHDPNLVTRALIYQVYAFCQQGMKRQAVRQMRLVHKHMRSMRRPDVDPVLLQMFKAAIHRIRNMHLFVRKKSESLSLVAQTISRTG